MLLLFKGFSHVVRHFGLFIHLFVILLRFGCFIANQKLFYAPQAIMSGRKGGGSWKLLLRTAEQSRFPIRPFKF